MAYKYERKRKFFLTQSYSVDDADEEVQPEGPGGVISLDDMRVGA